VALRKTDQQEPLSVVEQVTSCLGYAALRRVEAAAGHVTSCLGYAAAKTCGMESSVFRCKRPTAKSCVMLKRRTW